jgi:hypothetical protein
MECTEYTPFQLRLKKTIAGDGVDEEVVRELQILNATKVRKPRKNTHTRPVRCVETGVVYPSVHEAAEVIGVTASSVRIALRKNRCCADYHWEYVWVSKNPS